MSDEHNSIFLECPRCGTTGALRIGQSVHRGKLRWYETVNCANCGLRSEADGLGFPAENIRLKIIEKAGLWQVAMGTPAMLPSFVKTIRDALGMESLDAMRVAKSLPGPVYAGTHSEVQWLGALLSDTGESPQIERLSNA